MAGGNDGAQFGTSLSTPQAEAMAVAAAPVWLAFNNDNC